MEKILLQLRQEKIEILKKEYKQIEKRRYELQSMLNSVNPENRKQDECERIIYEKLIEARNILNNKMTVLSCEILALIF